MVSPNPVLDLVLIQGWLYNSDTAQQGHCGLFANDIFEQMCLHFCIWITPVSVVLLSWVLSHLQCTNSIVFNQCAISQLIPFTEHVLQHLDDIAPPTLQPLRPTPVSMLPSFTTVTTCWASRSWNGPCLHHSQDSCQLFWNLQDFQAACNCITIPKLPLQPQPMYFTLVHCNAFWFAKTTLKSWHSTETAYIPRRYSTVRTGG